MRRTLLELALFALLSFLIPLACFLLSDSTRPAAAEPAPTATAEPAPEAPAGERTAAPEPTPTGEEPLLVLDTGTNTVLTVPVRDYVLGSVASEMPITWPDEALKAQAVASHSYALYQKSYADRRSLSGAFLSADPARREGFMTDEVLHSYWADAYDKNYARLAALVDEVLDQVLLYEGEPAAACYHAISNGRTEASQNVWEQTLPYLQGVDSHTDRADPDCEARFNLTRPTNTA